MRESEQDGLVIDRAEYGYWPPTDRKPRPGFEEPRTTDVSFAVANLVDRGQLVIGAKTVKVSEVSTLRVFAIAILTPSLQHQIIGFHDPAPLLKKRLKIWYTFQNRSHFVEIADKEGVILPQRAHLCPESEQFNPLAT